MIGQKQSRFWIWSFFLDLGFACSRLHANNPALGRDFLRVSSEPLSSCPAGELGMQIIISYSQGRIRIRPEDRGSDLVFASVRTPHPPCGSFFCEVCLGDSSNYNQRTEAQNKEHTVTPRYTLCMGSYHHDAESRRPAVQLGFAWARNGAVNGAPSLIVTRATS